MIGYRETKTVNSNAIDILLTEASAPIRWRLEREILGRDRPKTVRKSDLMGWSPVRKNLATDRRLSIQLAALFDGQGF